MGSSQERIMAMAYEAKSEEQIRSIINDVEYREAGMSFRFCKLDDNGHYTLQVEVSEESPLAVDIQTGDVAGWRSGKALISQWMTENEIVRTAHSLVVRAYMHEIDERFRYKGRCLFNPHLDPSKLATHAGRIGNFEFRGDSMMMEEDQAA